MTPRASQRFWFETSSSGGKWLLRIAEARVQCHGGSCEVRGARSGTGIYLYGDTSANEDNSLRNHIR